MSTSTNWAGSEWSKENLCHGNGVVVEGTIKSKRIHSVFVGGKDLPAASSQNTAIPTRFFAIVVHVENAVRRNYDANGYEIAPKVNRSKAIAKGHLNHFDKQGASNVEQLNYDQLLSTVGGNSGHPLPPGFLDSQWAKLHPNVEGNFEFWGDIEKLAHKDLASGDEIRLKTIGDSIFIDSLASLDANSALLKSFAGGAELGNSWTNKIMSSSEKGADKADDDDDDAEWD